MFFGSLDGVLYDRRIFLSSVVLPGGYAFHKFSIQFTTFHNFSQLFTTLFFFVGEAFKCRHLHFRNPSGQWWGQFAEMDKFSSFPHSTQYTGTQVHHITFYLVNPKIPLNGWATTQPKKNPPKKIKSIHNFSQLFALFTTFHNFSPFFTIFHQPSQFYSGFRVVKTCENLSHFVKICEMHTPREAPKCCILPQSVTRA